MARVALLSNPKSTGNQSMLPRVRAFCDLHKDIFHYEVEHADQIGMALRTIAKVKPEVLVINGGDGTVQATLTEMFDSMPFGDVPPPVAVLPNGKTNLIAQDLGADGDAVDALARVLEIARSGIEPHIVTRELIALNGGSRGGKPVLGMFLGGAVLADTMLYCRDKIYPLGLPNGVAHLIAFFAGLISIILGKRASFLPPRPADMKISVLSQGHLQGRFAVLMVTTLERVLLKNKIAPKGQGGMLQLLIIERRPLAILRAFSDALRGRLGRHEVRGIHLQRSDEIRIEGEHSNLILDGELFEAKTDRPIVLTSTAPVPFLRLAA
ncbi:MAG TPA: diacylglycerol kinase family protein [Allosphingosinicella sp.]|nr:diacylglycerol kinase family protein [Allosphingosinicella sp.]